MTINTRRGADDFPGYACLFVLDDGWFPPPATNKVNLKLTD